MKKRYLKGLALSLATVLSISLLASCANSSDASSSASSPAASGDTVSVTAPGTFPIVEQPVEISIMVPQYSSMDPTTSWVNEEYEKMTGVTINWTVIPQDAWADKVAITFASGDLPDVIAGMDTYNISPTDELQYANQGLIIPLADLVETHSTYFKDFLKESPATKKLISQDDGDFYSMPSLAVCYHCNYSQKMFINKTWLDNLNMEMPTTTEEYYQVLKAFKEQDANGNGDPNDEIPLITCTSGWHVDLDGFLMCAFTYSDPDTRMAVEDGNVIFTPATDAYREGLQYLNKLYAEELISPESFTNDEPTNTKMNVTGADDDLAVIGSYPFAYQNYSSDTDLWRQYEILPPIEGPNGFVTTPNYALTRDVVRGNFAITKNAKNPEVIIRWLDWFYTMDGMMFRTGREGIDWRVAEEGALDFNGNQAAYEQLMLPEEDPYYINSSERNVDWTQNIPVNYSKEYRESAVAAQDWKDPTIDNGGEIQLFHGTKPYEAVARSVQESLPGLNVPADKVSDYNRMKTEIETYSKEMLVKFITGASNLDSDWDDYKAQLESMGLPTYLEISNEAYHNYLAR